MVRDVEGVVRVAIAGVVAALLENRSLVKFNQSFNCGIIHLDTEPVGLAPLDVYLGQEEVVDPPHDGHVVGRVPRDRLVALRPSGRAQVADEKIRP